jgi:hypothetical protein
VVVPSGPAAAFAVSVCEVPAFGPVPDEFIQSLVRAPSITRPRLDALDVRCPTRATSTDTPATRVASLVCTVAVDARVRVRPASVARAA